jgi:hypothetical protein
VLTSRLRCRVAVRPLYVYGIGVVCFFGKRIGVVVGDWLKYRCAGGLSVPLLDMSPGAMWASIFLFLFCPTAMYASMLCASFQLLNAF